MLIEMIILPNQADFFFKCFEFFPLHQILCNLLAVDGVNEPDVLAINGGKYKNKDSNYYCCFFI